MRLINEEYRALDRSPRALRQFGFTIGGAFCSLGALFLWRARAGGSAFLILGTLLILTALFQPRILRPVHRVWMTLALILGFVMTRVILTIVFFAVLTPIGLLQRLFGKRAVEVAFRTGAESYWEPRTPHQPTAADYEKQF